MKKLLLAILTLGTLLGAGVAFLPAEVLATHTTCGPGTRRQGEPIPHSNARQAEAFCNGGISGEEQAAADEQAVRVSADCKTVPLNSNNCPFLKNYVVPAVSTLSGAVGVVVLIMIAWGGLQYTSSRDNPQQAAAAKNHITNALFALAVYIFMVAFLNWLVPGGIF